MRRFRLDKLLQEIYPQVGEIWKYTAFPAGTLPEVLVKQLPQKFYSFSSKANDKAKAAIYKCIKAGKDCTVCSVLWVVELDASNTSPTFGAVWRGCNG